MSGFFDHPRKFEPDWLAGVLGQPTGALRAIEFAPVGAGQVGHLQIDLGHVGVLEVGVREVSIKKGGRFKVGLLKICASHDGLLESDALQILALPVCVIEIDAARDGDASARLQRRGAATLRVSMALQLLQVRGQNKPPSLGFVGPRRQREAQLPPAGRLPAARLRIVKM